MIKLLFLIMFISTNFFAQSKKINKETFIVFPEPNTYTVLNKITFCENEVVIRDVIEENINKYNYKIVDGNLILDNGVNYGEMNIYKNSILFFDKNKSHIEYLKLKGTKLNCNSSELNEILKKSCWEFSYKSDNEKLCIGVKSDIKIIKVIDTYVLISDNNWVFPIQKISRDLITFYKTFNKEEALAKRMNYESY